jgi:ABC-type nitrate/sulfonate/bicarbonate transport system substrate-binding protein
VLSAALHEAGVRDGATLRSIARERRGESRLTFGVVFPYSSHHLFVRQWLTRAGLRPDEDVRIVVVPPAQMYRNLEAGTIDGYCTGEPWGTIAVRAGVGWCPTWSAAQMPGHLEKALMVTERFVAERPAEHAALVAALAEACAWCDAPENREPLAAMLATPQYLNVPAAALGPALSGRLECGYGRTEEIPDFLTFHRGGINVPTPAKAAVLQHELTAAGLLPSSVPATLPHQLFREDLHRAALGRRAAGAAPG